MYTFIWGECRMSCDILCFAKHVFVYSQDKGVEFSTRYWSRNQTTAICVIISISRSLTGNCLNGRNLEYRLLVLFVCINITYHGVSSLRNERHMIFGVSVLPKIWSYWSQDLLWSNKLAIEKKIQQPKFSSNNLHAWPVMDSISTICETCQIKAYVRTSRQICMFE